MTISVTAPERIEFTTSADPQDYGLTVIHANGLKVGYVTHSGAAWFGTYLPTKMIVAYDSFNEAMDAITGQHRAMLMLAQSVRAIRPAQMLNGPGSLSRAYDDGYNQALRDVERVLRSMVGQAPEGEGYTAITR